MHFLGIDLGTASLKLAIIDEQGRERAASGATYPIETPVHGWAQTPVSAWWQALVDAAAHLPSEARAAVSAIGIAGQMHGVVLVDAHARAVRPAMLWPDTRAASLMDAWSEPQPNPVAPGMAGPLLRWITLNDPQAVAATRWALQPKDWLRMALGGSVVTDPSDACATALAFASGEWDHALIDRLSLPRGWFAPCCANSYALAGTLSSEAAHALGLPAGVALAAGAADTASAALGSGLTHDGDALVTTGSGGQIVVLSSDEPTPARGLHRYRTATGQWYRMAAMQNVGVALETVRGWLSYASWPDAYRDAFHRDAAPTNGSKLSFLPYLSGERSPWMNAAARGGWLGLSLDDTRGTMMRAAFEGVAFSLRAGLDAIRANAHASGGAPVHRLRLAGGGSVEPRWRQLLADALDADLEAVSCPNVGARGAALVAGLATGHWREADLPALAPPAEHVASPRGDTALAARYARFLDLYGRTEGWFDAPF
ncbi:FGGY family carbohydrate kinase [Trinickia sp. LjRoot230]|uniref:FGGY family carbohydrate kinase n=1 Tax=Trinickia sp. LjRoot230 TaxID=3342288 RepID=UPI003ECC8734